MTPLFYMRTLEEFLFLEVLSKTEVAKVHNIQILANDEGQLYLTWEDKDGKVYKCEIKNRILGSLNETFETYVATEMLRLGYSLVPIEGGFEVYGGSEVYQLLKEECTCPHYIYKRSKCIHLVFKDWHLAYRQRTAKLKRDNHG